DEQLPRHGCGQLRDAKFQILMPGVEHDEKAFIDVALAARGVELAGGAAQDIADAARHWIPPILDGRFLALRRDPADVLEAGFRNRLAAEEARPREDAMAAAQIDEETHEIAELLVLRTDAQPVGPRDIVVLAVSVVVAALRAADLVAREQHRNTQRQQQGGEQIALLLVAKRRDRRIVGRPLGPAVPAEITVVAVAIALAIGLVVLLVVRDEIGQREAVMGGDEIHARPGPPAAMRKDVRRAGEARGEIGDDALVALPEAAHRVTVLRVPFRPTRREATELVA